MPFKIAKKYTEAYENYKGFASYLLQAQSRLNIDSETALGFARTWTAFANEFNIYADRARQTAASRQQVATTYNAMIAEVRKLKKFLKYSRADLLTTEDYYKFNIPKPKTTYTHAKIPHNPPVNVLLEVKHLTHKVLTLAEGQTSRSRAVPKGTARIMRFVAITDDKNEPEFKQYRAIDSVNRTTHMIIWKDADVGKIGWLITKYANAKDESGIHSYSLMLPII